MTTGSAATTRLSSANSSGTILFPFLHPGDTLTFIADTPGVHFVFNTTDSFGSADVTVGSTSASAQSPDSIVVRQMQTDGFMTLASNGTIIEGGTDASPDVTAAALVLSAVTGIGTPTSALEIQTTFIEAETTTGGINLVNFGQVQIGGITADVNGLNVVNSGNLNFLNYGPIFLADTTGTVIVHGGDLSGNVILTAVGADADIYDTIDMPAIYAAGGGITLNAGRDILLGLGGASYNNDVLATQDIRITAGRDFLLDGTSNIRTGAFGGVVGGEVIVTAGRTINLSNTTGGLQTIESFNGDITLTTGPGGFYIQNTSFPATVQTTGDIFLNADNVLLISGGLNTTGIGRIAVRPVTPGRPIDVGTTLDPFLTLGLSDAEFDRFFTLNVSIGDAATGNVDFSAPISEGPFPIALTVQSGNDILFRSSLTLSSLLTLRAGDDISFAPTASFTSTSDGLLAFVDDAQDDDNLGGLGTLAGTLTVATTIRLNGNLDADTLNGSAANDMLTGNGGNDTLVGNGGNDQLNGGPGADTTNGGLGDDVHFVDSAADIVVEAAGEGTDTVQSSISFGLGADFENLTLTGTADLSGTGNGLDNTIFGNVGNNSLNGAAGADSLRGLAGNDTYTVDNAGDVVIETAGAGTDLVNASVSFTLGVNVENLTLIGTGNINGTGNTLVNVINGNVGANVLNGGTGADTMAGSVGNDTYVVDNVGDVVTEAAAAGTDTVQSSITYTLGATLENLTLIGGAFINGTGNTLSNTIIGNSLANTLTGLGGFDTLDGGLGGDTLVGGTGNDTYIVDNGSDTVTEAVGEGTDTVQSSISYTLGANLENLTLTGIGNVHATGNALVNILLGNAGNNTLNGLVGADTMNGGAGNDTYVVDNAGDTAGETVGAGTDIVQSSVTFTLGANVENLTLTGVGNINGTGNALVNTINGNVGANMLDGGAGADIMAGSVGNDTYIVDNGGDIVTEAASAGTDLVQSSMSFTLGANVENLTLTGGLAVNGTGNNLANTILGNGNVNILSGGDGIDAINAGAGNDDLFGGAGSDDLTGGTGADRFRFDSALSAATNVDDILDYSVVDDTIFLDRDIFTGIAVNGTLAAGAFRAGTSAGDADDRIVYDAATGNIFYDADGLGGVAQILFATVTPATALTNADFNAYI